MRRTVRVGFARRDVRLVQKPEREPGAARRCRKLPIGSQGSAYPSTPVVGEPEGQGRLGPVAPRRPSPVRRMGQQRLLAVAVDKAPKNRRQEPALSRRERPAIGAPWAVYALGRVWVHHPLDQGRTVMATAAERMRALRDRARRGLRRFTITVNADDPPRDCGARLRRRGKHRPGLPISGCQPLH